MNQNYRRSGFAAAWILFSAFLALYVISNPWEGAGERDFRPPATVFAIILFVSAMAFRVWLRWSWVALLGGLAITEIFTLWIIAYFSGAELFSLFNLRWLLYINIYIALPWLAGAAIGSGIILLRDHQTNSG